MHYTSSEPGPLLLIAQEYFSLEGPMLLEERPILSYLINKGIAQYLELDCQTVKLKLSF